MRILFMTNFYPPHARGGEEYSCQQAAEGLRRRGHEILVLTSNYGSANGVVGDEMVSRSLLLEMEFLAWANGLRLPFRRRLVETHDLRRLNEVLDSFRPDLVFIWGMWNLPRSLAQLAEKRCAGRVVYRFATYWPALPSQYVQYWLAPGRTRATRLLRRLIRPVALALTSREENEAQLQFRHIICVSEAVRKELLALGINANEARTIYTGLDITKYKEGAERVRTPEGNSLRLLYCGRLTAEKGVHTVIEALHLLRENGPPDVRICLDIAGAGDREYEGRLRSLVADLALDEEVTFLGHMPFETMPALYASSDVLVVPSVWAEPLARAILEGMASGLLIIATPQGGTGEIIRDKDTGLLFAAGDAADLADKLLFILHQPSKRLDLVAAAYQTVTREFNEQRMLDQMEQYLLEVHNLY